MHPLSTPSLLWGMDLTMLLKRLHQEETDKSCLLHRANAIKMSQLGSAGTCTCCFFASAVFSTSEHQAGMK